MNKIETDFNKLKKYEDIETYYPPLEDIKDFLYELFGNRVESQKYIVRANKQIQELTNNWNELEECIKKEMADGRSETNLWLMGCYDEDKKILDKMKEIKGDKE